MTKKYYFFYLEIALRQSEDNKVYSFENVSHIPTEKLIEIFNIDLKKDPYILDGYFLTKKNYKKHKEFINKEIGKINLKAF
jgi:hypothetical protein